MENGVATFLGVLPLADDFESVPRPGHPREARSVLRKRRFHTPAVVALTLLGRDARRHATGG
jgi:hypothetical protein